MGNLSLFWSHMTCQNALWISKRIQILSQHSLQSFSYEEVGRLSYMQDKGNKSINVKSAMLLWQKSNNSIWNNFHITERIHISKPPCLFWSARAPCCLLGHYVQPELSLAGGATVLFLPKVTRPTRNPSMYHCLGGEMLIKEIQI